MINAFVLASFVLYQADSLESRLKAQLLLIRDVSISHGCDPSLFEFWDVPYRGSGDGVSQLTLHTYATANVSLLNGSLSFRSDNPSSKALTAGEQTRLWSQEKCTELAKDVLQALRPGVVHELGAGEYEVTRGRVKLVFLAKHGTLTYREGFMGATTVEMDAKSGRIWYMYVVATPTVRAENLHLSEGEAVLRQRAIDAYSSFVPYASARIGLAEFCVMSPRVLISFPGAITDRHRQIAARDEGMLMYRVIFQRMQEGQPKADYRYVYVDATTGVPMATYEFALEAGRRGAPSSPVEGIEATGSIRVFGSTGKYVALEPAQPEKGDNGLGEPLLIEYESGVIVKAVHFESDGVVLIGNLGRFKACDELKEQIRATKERRLKLPTFVQPVERVPPTLVTAALSR